MERSLVFQSAKNVQHPVFGECRMEVWRVHKPDEQNKVCEPEYVVQYYKNGALVDSSY